MAYKVTVMLYFIFIVNMAEGVDITISGSRKYAIEDQPFTFTCAFNSNAVTVKELHKNGIQVQGVQLSTGGSGTCYNVVKVPLAQCDPSFCNCNQHGNTFTAWWTLPTINNDTGRWTCVEVNHRSPELVLRLAVPVSTVTLEGISGPQVSVVADQSTSLSCVTSTSRPRSYIQWFIGNTNYTSSSTSTVINGLDEKTSTKSTLTITPTRSQANLAVNCKAYNIDPDTTVELATKPKLNVQYPPSDFAAVINEASSSMSVTEGTSMSLQCEVKGGNPLAVINWNCFGGTVTNTSVSGIARANITFTSSFSQNGQSCSCSATHPAAVIGSDSVQLNVTYSPKSVTLQPSDLSYTKNENQSLGPIQCSADCNPSCSYTWTGPGTFTVNGPILSINSIKKEQAGNYNCKASNSLGTELSRNVVINVNYGPKSVILQPSNLSYTKNESQSLGPINCSADCNPSCSYTWTGPGTFTVNGPILSINSIKKEQAGNYTCTATNSLGTKFSGNLVVNVNYAANMTSMTIDGNNFTISEHSLPTIICTAEGLPQPVIKLVFVSNNTVIAQVTGLSLQYKFPYARCEDTGQYKCEAVNKIKPQSSPFIRNVYILCSPRPLSTSTADIVLGSEDTLDITASFISYPKPAIKWEYTNAHSNIRMQLKNDQPNIEINNTHQYRSEEFKHISHLIRKVLRKEDFGIYLATATNFIGSSSIVFSVVAKGKPNSPSSVTAFCITFDSVLLVWTSSSNNGAEQRFGITYRIQNGKQKILDISKDEPGFGRQLHHRINNLDGSRTYVFSISSKNMFGKSFSAEVNCTTSEKPKKSFQEGLIAGMYIAGFVSAVIIIMLTSFIFRKIRRHKNKKKGETFELDDNHGQDQSKYEDVYTGTASNAYDVAGIQVMLPSMKVCRTEMMYQITMRYG